MRTIIISVEFEDGYEAYNNGENYDNNPYQVTNDEAQKYADWVAGYDQARIDESRYGEPT